MRALPGERRRGVRVAQQVQDLPPPRRTERAWGKAPGVREGSRRQQFVLRFW